MTDVFAKAIADLKLPDFAGDVPAPPKLQQPSSLDILREAGMANANGSRRSIDIAGDLIRMERDAKKAAGAADPTLAIPSWQQAIAGIQGGYDNLPYDQKKQAHDAYVQRAVAELRKVDPKTDPLLLQQKVVEQAPAPVDPTEGKGDIARGWVSAWRNTKAAAAGAVGLALSKLGEDKYSRELFAAMQEYTKQAGDIGKVNDSFVEALKPNGSLVDWAQYSVGQMLPSIAESIMTAGIGAMAGGAATGGVGALPAAATGLVAKSVVKKKIFNAIAKEMREDATQRIAAGATREVALKAAREAAEAKLQDAARDAGRKLGAGIALFGASEVRGVGEIAQNAQQDGLDPAQLSVLNTALGATTYAALETFSDKLLLDTIMKGVKGTGVKRTLLRGASTAATEGATEVGQDVATGLAAGTGVPDPAQLVDAFAAGAVGGGAVGGAAALLRGNQDEAGAATNTPGATATPELTDEELAAAPADEATVDPGTTMELDGATLVMGADGQWAYAEGSPANDLADGVLALQGSSSPGLAAAAVGAAGTITPPAEPVVEGEDFTVSELPDTIDFEPMDADGFVAPQAASTPTVEFADDGDVQVGETPAPVEAKTLVNPAISDPAQAFTVAIDTLADGGQLNDSEVDALNAFTDQAVPLINQLAEGISTGAPNPNARAQLAPLVGKLWGEMKAAGGNGMQLINDIVNQMPDGNIQPNEANALPYVFKQLGMLNGIEASQSPWAVEARKPGATVEGVLAATMNDSTVGRTRSAGAAAILNIYKTIGRAFPKLTYNPNETTNWWNPNGVIQLGSQANASTLTHEAAHDLTVAGWKRVNQRAQQGDVEAQGVVALVEELHAAMVKRANGTQYYALADNYNGDTPRNRSELFADLLEPGFLALAAQTPINVSTLSESAKAGLQTVNAKADDSVLAILRKAVDYILRALSPDKGLDQWTITAANLLTNVAAYTATPSTAKAQAVVNAPKFEVNPGAGTTAPPSAPAPTGATASAQTDWSTFTAPPETKLKALKPKYWGHNLVWPDVVTKAIYMVGKPGKALSKTHYPIIAWLDAVGVPPAQVNALYKQILVDIKAKVKKSGSKTATINVSPLNKMSTGNDATLVVTGNTALDAQLKQEFDATAKKYGGSAAWMQAKAAGKTVLDYRAWVQVRTPRFLLWYGDWINGQTPNTLTLNRKTGEPREFYRGVASNYFKAFNDGKGRSFFTDSRKMAETYGSKVYPVFLRSPKPYVVEGKGNVWGNLPLDEATEPAPGKTGSTDSIVNYAFGKGYQTVMFHDIIDNVSNNQKGVHKPADVIVVSNVRDAKSSTANSGEFATNADVADIFNDPGDPLFSVTPEAPVDNDVKPDRRTATSSLIADITTGAPASASTPARGLLQAAKAKDKAAFSKALSTFGERINEELHDASIRMKRWLQTLPEGDSLPALLKQRVIGSMYTARKKRDDVLRRMYDEHLAAIDSAVTKFAAKHKLSTETATRDIGYAATAKTIPARNAFLLRKRLKAVAALQKEVADALAAQQTASTAGMVPAAQAAAAAAPVQSTKLDELQAQLSMAQKQLTELVAAINSSNIKVKKHGGGGVAGMNNAQAKALLDGLLTRYGADGFAEIEAVVNRIYDMNAAKLALDIESGKVAPSVAAEFLERPAALVPMQELRDLANTVDAADKASVDALEAKRKEVIDAVRSEYVPLSGDPTKDIDDASFHGGSGIPNVQRDYELQGRERGAPPDEGLSTSRAALMKSASYYGWRDFQDGIAAIHAALTPEERQAVGIRAEKVEPGRSTLSNKAVIRHRNGKTTAYIFNDEQLVDAIRGASRLENNFLLEGAGKVTKAYSYLATQANPFFAPFNFIRDSWERSEFLRTRTYLRTDGSQADSKSIAHSMLKYLADPNLTRATARYAFGKPVDTSSRTGRYLDEFLRQGGVSVFSSQFGADRAKIIAQINKQKSWRQQVGTLSRWIDGYNKTFDVGPALASYMAMRDAGMNTKDAAAGALDLMDFGKRGKSASVFGSIYAFAQPTFTGAANAITALRDPLTGKMNKVGMTRMAAYVGGFLMLQAFLRSLADDDEGGNKLDQQSGFTKNNFLLIPYGEDGMIKVPLAYGLTRVANGIARAALGVGTNEQTPTEAVGKLVSGSVVPVFSPIEDSDIDWFERPAQALMTLFAPSWLKPPLAIATNTTPFDSQIVKDKYGDPTKFKSEQFGKYSPEAYKDMAVALRQATGIDMAPEEIRYLFRAYPTGILQMGINGPLEDKSIGEAAQKKVYADYSEFARYFQFKKAIDETDELLKRTKAGEPITDDMERQKLMWRLQWDETDKELRAEKGKATRAATKAGVKPDAIDGQFGDKRMAAQVRALYYYRLMQGKDAVVGEPPVTADTTE